MSIQSEIDRIKNNVAGAYSAVEEMGGTVPEGGRSALLPSAIKSIPKGIDTSDATAASGDILSGRTAYVKGAKVTGSIASKGAADLTASGAAVSVPAGYYPSAVSKSVAAATQATPSISIDAAGKITASATQTAGYVAAGTKSGTKQMTVQAAKTITPGTAKKTAVASGVYTTGTVEVAGDANLVAENILKGTSIFGVTGTLRATMREVSVTSLAANVIITDMTTMPEFIILSASKSSRAQISAKKIYSAIFNVDADNARNRWGLCVYSDTAATIKAADLYAEQGILIPKLVNGFLQLATATYLFDTNLTYSVMVLD